MGAGAESPQWQTASDSSANSGSSDVASQCGHRCDESFVVVLWQQQQDAPVEHIGELDSSQPQSTAQPAHTECNNSVTAVRHVVMKRTALDMDVCLRANPNWWQTTFRIGEDCFPLASFYVGTNDDSNQQFHIRGALGRFGVTGSPPVSAAFSRMQGPVPPPAEGVHWQWQGRRWPADSQVPE